MQLYTIIPLDLKHTDEICEDIKQQYETGVDTITQPSADT